jgi:hypothetical protein
MDEEILKIQKALEEKFVAVQTQLQTLQKEGASKEELEKAIKAIEIQGQALEDFISEQKAKAVLSLEQKFANFLFEKQEEIGKIFKAGSGEIVFNPFVDKVPAAITTGSGTDEETVPPVMNTQLGTFNLRNDNDLLSYATTSSSSTPVVTYVEMIPKDGDYAFVAEGAEKPQIDFKWEKRYPTPKKAAAYIILTEESVTDYKRLESVAREYLRKKHDLFKVNAVYFGTGIGALPTGATVYGRTFVAGDMADALALGKVNFMDIVNAAITDIYTTQNYVDEASYMANIVMVSPIDFYLNLVAAKDDNGLPLYPQAGLFNTVTIGGVTIKPWIKIPAGKIFVADMSKYNVVNYIPFSIRIGWINDQFITNEFTMLGESRFFQYVQNLDQAAFIYDDIATIKAAIEAAA